MAWGLCCAGGKSRYQPVDGVQAAEGEYLDIKHRCIRSGRLWEDPDFSPEDANLDKINEVQNAKWKRPGDIMANPVFISDGATHEDVDQYMLGTCWFLAPLTSLLYKNPKQLLARIMPRDQGFGQQYCGAFHFMFWEDDKWKDIIIDDRLPTTDGKLCFTRNISQPQEFWMPLMEKALAKLRGGYDEIDGGRPEWAFKNLTGSESIRLILTRADHRQELRKNLHGLMKMSTLLVCATSGRGATKLKEKGLVKGHAYSILGVREVTTANGTFTLLNIRNPWGQNSREWTGDWSDKSPLWNSVTDSKFSFTPEDDGEFWMDLDTFFQKFYEVVIVFLKDSPNQKSWHTKSLQGRRDPDHPSRVWKKKKKNPPKNTKGKSGKKTTNPQLELRLQNATSPAKVFVFLEEWDSSAVRTGLLSEPVVFKRIGMDSTVQLKTNMHSENEQYYPKLRRKTICRQFTLTLAPDDIVTLPCFIRPDTQAEFQIKIYSEENFTLRELETPVKLKD